MSERDLPQTEAGRRLLHYLITNTSPTLDLSWVGEHLLAIEQEARAAAISEDDVKAFYPDIIAKVEARVRADLAARIVAAVEGLPGYRDPRYSGMYEATGIVSRAAVLRAIREASDERA